MDRDKIEFDISSMDNTEYKLREIASLSPEEVDKLEKEKQILFVSVRDDIEPVSNILVMAPKAWFMCEADFINRVQTDLKTYVTDVIEHIFEEGSEDICEMIDHMGLIPFINYVSMELMQEFSYPLIESEIEDFGRLVDKKAGLLKMSVCQLTNNTLLCNKALYDDAVLDRLLEQADIITGVMCIRTDQGVNMKESYVMKIRLLNDYSSVDEPELAFVNDVKELYTDFLDREE